MKPRLILTTNDLCKVHQELAEYGRKLIETKNADYGDHNKQHPDPFANFRRHGILGILVRMDDKLARLTTFAKTGKLQVIDEGVLDTAVDLMNYAAILVAYLMDDESKFIIMANIMTNQSCHEQREEDLDPA